MLGIFANQPRPSIHGGVSTSKCMPVFGQEQNEHNIDEDTVDPKTRVATQIARTYCINYAVGLRTATPEDVYQSLMTFANQEPEHGITPKIARDVITQRYPRRQ